MQQGSYSLCLQAQFLQAQLHIKMETSIRQLVESKVLFERLVQKVGDRAVLVLKAESLKKSVKKCDHQTQQSKTNIVAKFKVQNWLATQDHGIMVNQQWQLKLQHFIYITSKYYFQHGSWLPRPILKIVFANFWPVLSSYIASYVATQLQTVYICQIQTTCTSAQLVIKVTSWRKSYVLSINKFQLFSQLQYKSAASLMCIAFCMCQNGFTCTRPAPIMPA